MLIPVVKVKINICSLVCEKLAPINDATATKQNANSLLNSFWCFMLLSNLIRRYNEYLELPNNSNYLLLLNKVGLLNRGLVSDYSV